MLTLANLLDSDDYIYPEKIIKFVRTLVNEGYFLLQQCGIRGSSHPGLISLTDRLPLNSARYEAHW